MKEASTAAAAFAVLGTSKARAGANDKLGVGFIGCGSRANNHMQTIHWLKEDGGEAVEIVAMCDAYRPRMAKAADGFGGKQYTNYKGLLGDANVDIVCIATPDHQHGYQALDAIKAGKDVYCEKPVTHWRQFELTKKLAHEVRKSGRVLQLGTQGMSDSAWHQMKKLVQQGRIGQPIHAECGYFRVGDWGERGMPIDDANAKPGKDLDWEAFLSDSPKREFDVSRYFRWRMYEDYAGGPCTDLYPHSLTPVAHILGVKFPSMVAATGGKYRYQEREVPDTFNMLVDYPEGISVAVLGTQGNNYSSGLGTRGAGNRIPVIRGWEGTLTIIDNEITFIPRREDWMIEASKEQPERIKIEHGEDQVEFWRTFLHRCRDGDPKTLSPMELGYYVQAACHMAMLGLKAGKIAKFDAEKEQIIL
jgi:predicted dehydrogenase